MQWQGEGLIIGVRRHGESSVIAELVASGRGRCLGLVRGGRSPRLAATLQAGNSVEFTWRARLEDHLGTFTLEVTKSRAADLIADRIRLYAAQVVCDHLRLLPERDPHDRLLDFAIGLLDFTGDPAHLSAGLARFELTLLDELGFGLDLTNCAATGVTTGLTHVSPRSARAVSREAAEPYLDRLLRLPAFFIDDGAGAGPDDLRAAFALTGYFLDLHVFSPRRLDPPAMRQSFIDLTAG